MNDACSPDLDFPGHDKLVQAIDAAVANGDQHAITAALRNTLCMLIRDRDVRLPDCVHEPISDHYARRELYRSPAHGYSVVAMTWGPGQGTPLHDHAGIWCVEGVVEGRMDVTQFDLVEEDRDAFRFEQKGCVHAAVGSAGCLIPPFEYHVLANALDEPSMTIHIYGGEMKSCHVFEPVEGGRYVRRDRALCYHD